MINEYVAIANKNIDGLVKGEEYIIISDSNNNTVEVYDANMNYLLSCNADNFDRWYELY